MRRLFVLVVVSLIVASTRAYTQDPTAIVFQKSVDHAATDLGQPILTSYAVELYNSPTGSALKVVDVGKPAPAGNGDISVSFASIRSQITTGPGTYYVKVFAVGPNGRAGTPMSDPFPLQVRTPAAPPGKPIPQ